MRIEQSWFDRPDGASGAHGIHGTGHTRRVLTHALEIASALEVAAWERKAVELAAGWHDIGRTNDGVDYYHGAKSAGKVVGLGLHQGIDAAVLEVALFAVTHHSGGEQHAESAALRTRDADAALKVFRVLKDADALDRVRLGDLDVSYLRFGVSHEYLERAWALLDEVES